VNGTLDRCRRCKTGFHPRRKSAYGCVPGAPIRAYVLFYVLESPHGENNTGGNGVGGGGSLQGSNYCSEARASLACPGPLPLHRCAPSASPSPTPAPVLKYLEVVTGLALSASDCPSAAAAISVPEVVNSYGAGMPAG
jgi:hypothetical protein